MAWMSMCGIVPSVIRFCRIFCNHNQSLDQYNLECSSPILFFVCFCVCELRNEKDLVFLRVIIFRMCNIYLLGVCSYDNNYTHKHPSQMQLNKLNLLCTVVRLIGVAHRAFSVNNCGTNNNFYSIDKIHTYIHTHRHTDSNTHIRDNE